MGRGEVGRGESSEPWRERFRVPRVLSTQLAEARRERGLAVGNWSGCDQLHAWEVATGELRQLTDRPEGVLFGFVAPDARHVYYLDDQGGDEVGHLVRVAFTGGASEDVTPELPPYSTLGGAISATGNLLAFTLADGEGYALVAIDLSPEGGLGQPRFLHRSEGLFWPPVLSPDGRIAVVASTERTGTPQFSLLAFDTGSGERVAELWDGPGTSVETGPFARSGAGSAGGGDARLAGTTDRSEFRRPLVWHPVTGERRDLRVDRLEGDVEPLDWSAGGDRLLLLQTHRASHRLWSYDLGADSLGRLDHPTGTYAAGAQFGPGGEIFAGWEDATHPRRVIALDPATGAATGTVLAAGASPPSRPFQSVSFTSADGQAIQGWLGVPDGPGPFPTILYTHGGPEDVDTDTYAPGAQAWLDHGFAFLSINYRGSITFGREFQQQIWGDLGRWELADMVAARDWLVREGIARPDLVFPSGWSYGGYLTLLALGQRPELWAGGLAGIAIADWVNLYEDSSDISKGFCVALFGGMPAEKPAQYAASSPLTYADRVAAPVLIIQGRNDTRTPARQVEVYAERLRTLGKPVEVEWFEAGHLGAASDVEQRIAHQERMLRFAERIVGRTE